MGKSSDKSNQEMSPTVSGLSQEKTNTIVDDASDSSSESMENEHPPNITVNDDVEKNFNAYDQTNKIEDSSDLIAIDEIVTDQLHSNDGKAKLNSMVDHSDSDEESSDKEPIKFPSKHHHERNRSEERQIKRRLLCTYQQKNFIHAKGNTICLEIG